MVISDTVKRGINGRLEDLGKGPTIDGVLFLGDQNGAATVHSLGRFLFQGLESDEALYEVKHPLLQSRCFPPPKDPGPVPLPGESILLAVESLTGQLGELQAKYRYIRVSFWFLITCHSCLRVRLSLCLPNLSVYICVCCGRYSHSSCSSQHEPATVRQGSTANGTGGQILTQSHGAGAETFPRVGFCIPVNERAKGILNGTGEKNPPLSRKVSLVSD